MSNVEHKLRFFKMVIFLNTKWKDCKCRQNLCTKNFTYTKKFYVFKITAVNLSKIYFMKNAKRTCKPNKPDLNRDWIRYLWYYIVIFGKHLSELYWIVLMFLDPQCIASQDFQHKILTGQLSSPSCPYMQLW